MMARLDAAESDGGAGGRCGEGTAIDALVLLLRFHELAVDPAQIRHWKSRGNAREGKRHMGRLNNSQSPYPMEEKNV